MFKLKNILNKLRPDHTDNKQVETVERIAVIGHSCDAIGWRPVSYAIPKHFEQFLSNLNTDMEHFIAQANPDKYNAHFFVSTIDNEVALALKELATQRIEHKRSIHNIRIYQKASLTDLTNRLKRMEETLKKNKEVIS